MKTLAILLLLATTAHSQTVDVVCNGETNRVELNGRALNLVFSGGVTNEVSPTGWHEHYYTEDECIDIGLSLDYTNKLWWCRPEPPAINEDTPYIYINAWECEGEYRILWTDDLNLPWLTFFETNASPYATTFKIYLPTNSPISRWITHADSGFFKLSSWNTNCIFSVDASDLSGGSSGGSSGGGGSGPPPIP